MELHKASVVPKPNQASSASIPLHFQQNTYRPLLTGGSAEGTTVAERLPATILLVTLVSDRRGEAPSAVQMDDSGNRREARPAENLIWVLPKIGRGLFLFTYLRLTVHGAPRPSYLDTSVGIDFVSLRRHIPTPEVRSRRASQRLKWPTKSGKRPDLFLIGQVARSKRVPPSTTLRTGSQAKLEQGFSVVTATVRW